MFPQTVCSNVFYVTFFCVTVRAVAVPVPADSCVRAAAAKTELLLCVQQRADVRQRQRR
jgi:hypothetical protein